MPFISETDRVPLSTEIRLGVFFLILLLLAIIIDSKIKLPLPILSEIEIPKSSNEIARGNTNKKQIIFTFDGGSKDISGQKILDILAKNQIKTTFFLTGDFVRKNYHLVKRMHGEGHEIYNHTNDHPYLTSISDREIVLELDSMDKELQKVIGKSSKPYFRPPYGDRDQRVLNIAYGAGYQSILWTIDALDWQESEGRSPVEVHNIILSSLAPGNIYLLHLGDNISGDILEDLILEVKKRGYNIVSLRQGL